MAQFAIQNDIEAGLNRAGRSCPSTQAQDADAGEVKSFCTSV